MLTDEQKKRILKLSADGMRQREIAEEVGTTQATVSRTVRAAAAEEPTKHKTLTAEEQSDLMELVADGYELAALAPDFGCDEETLAYYVRKHQRAESREREREDRIVCGDKFSGLLLDRGNGDFHGTFKNADGTFEHVDFHGLTREVARDEYGKWRQEMGERDKTYQAVFDKSDGRTLWFVIPEGVSAVLCKSEQEAMVLAENVFLLSGVKMTVSEVEV
ncbi:MAG: helix-turn-helix domain-containing protein [Atopobiaceae bacterium]|nr:helix-turn-helix domain-containing protein [Atopobiaceae bacterium]